MGGVEGSAGCLARTQELEGGGTFSGMEKAGEGRVNGRTVSLVLDRCV